MHVIRIAFILRLWVLGWFVASLGVSVAAPLVHPQPMQVVCTGTGVMLLLTQSDDGSMQKMGQSGMDCPLCSPVCTAAPPPVGMGVLLPAQPLAYALRTCEVARIVAATAAPLPARGPPALS